MKNGFFENRVSSEQTGPGALLLCFPLTPRSSNFELSSAAILTQFFPELA